MFNDIVESVMLEYELVRDIAWGRCLRLLCGLFRLATWSLLTLEHSLSAVCLPVVSDAKLVVSTSELMTDDSYTLDNWPFTLLLYLPCLRCRDELMILSVSVGQSGGCRPWDISVSPATRLSVHWEPPSDWFEPSEDTNQLTTRPLKHGNLAPSSIISSFTTLQNKIAF